MQGECTGIIHPMRLVVQVVSRPSLKVSAGDEVVFEDAEVGTCDLV